MRNRATMGSSYCLLYKERLREFLGEEPPYFFQREGDENEQKFGKKG